MIKVLIVEDDKAISNLIYMNLKDSGYLCECVYDGIEAANRIYEKYYDLVLLDIMLPGINGYDLIEYINEKGIPVIFITAKVNVEERVKGLKLGAEDYITKPFEIIELLARVETVLRRYNKQEQKLKIADLELDMFSMTVKKNGIPINLTKKEYDLLLLFIQNKNIALYRETIYERIWESNFMGDSRTVDLHVQRLRKKIGWEDRITAVYKVGYRLEV